MGKSGDKRHRRERSSKGGNNSDTDKRVLEEPLQKLMGKPWSSWNLPENPVNTFQRLREACQPSDPYEFDNQFTKLPTEYRDVFGTFPALDVFSVTKCPACGWLMKIQHATKHFLRDSRGFIVCETSDLAFFGNKVLGKALHPLGELKETADRDAAMNLLETYTVMNQKERAIADQARPPRHHHHHHYHHHHHHHDNTSSNSKSHKAASGASSHSKTEYQTSTSSTPTRSKSQVKSQPVYTPPPPTYTPKSRSGGATTSSSHLSITTPSSVSKGKGKSTALSSSTPAWSSSSSSSLRASTSATTSTNTKSSSHKAASHTNSGSYTLSIPSEDMGQNESVEDLLMSNATHSYGSSKHTVHIIATSNSKSKSTPTDYGHIKFYSDVPEKRMKLDSSSHSKSDNHHKSSSHHSASSSHTTSYETYKPKPKHSSSASAYNGVVPSSHSTKESTKSKSSSSTSFSKLETSSSSSHKHHHLRSTAPSTSATTSRPIMTTATLSSSSSAHSRSHGYTHSGSYIPPPPISSVDVDKERTAPAKKKKRKRDKDEPRKIIPLKDRDFNPDKHCGVCQDGSSLPCKRSLTCKTHSVALRRAVVGRSKSFDALLAAHKLAKTEEKNLKVKEIVEEVAPPKPKKKKPSGNTVQPAPNDLPSVAIKSEPRSYTRQSVSPDIEFITIKPMHRGVFFAPSMIHDNEIKSCPLVFPYRPSTQAKFETIWYNPKILDSSKVTDEEKTKFSFLLRHYKNPYFLKAEVKKPQIKIIREKRNVFSMWNPAEKPVSGASRISLWADTDTTQGTDKDDDDMQILIDA